MRKISFILYLLFFIICSAMADEVQVTARAPQQAVMGEQFRLQYIVNSNALQDIQLGTCEGFDVLAGPYTSSQSSFQMINGRTTQSSSVTVTYILMPTAEGKKTISPATLRVDGKTIKSKSLNIEVLPADKQASRGQQSVGGQSQQGSASQGRQSADSGKDLFITVTTSKRKVFEQEAVLVTYKVYTLVNLVQLQGKMPELNGCHQQEIELPQQKSLKMEHYNGRNYHTCVWSQYLVFPQQTGKVTIPAIPFEGIVQQAMRSMDPFEAFFGGGSLVQEVKRTITAPAVEIQVDPLPTPRPEGFSGAVGQFTLSTSLTPQELKANEAATLRMVVSGTGNMKLIKSPDVKFPKDFETYDPKITDKTHITSQGISGNKVFDYVVVPRHGGDYEVEAPSFIYFDPQSKSYKTLTGENYTVKVEKGAAMSTSGYTAVQKEDLELLAEDIRYIKRGNTHPVEYGSGLFGSVNYWLAYILSLLAFVVLVVVFRRQIAANADIARLRGRQAGKAANRRLKTARRMMKEHRPNEFYDEVLKALWGYVADKLNINVADLNRDNVSERLLEKGVEQTLVDQFLQVLSDCEFARYAPGDPNANMDKIYSQAESVLGFKF